jgi:hypothetical protein
MVAPGLSQSDDDYAAGQTRAWRGQRSLHPGQIALHAPMAGAGHETRYPAGFTIEATGDFLGRGIWTFEQEGDWVNATFDWRLRAEKPLLRYLSFLLKPLFCANHRWAMARGERVCKRNWARARTDKDGGTVAPLPLSNGLLPRSASVQQ